MFALAAVVLMAPMVVHAQADTRPSLAVLPFNNNVLGAGAADYAALGKGVADMMTTELLRNAGLRVVERERIAEIMREQDMGASGRVDQATAARLGRLVGARHMLYGDITTDLDPSTRRPINVTIAVRAFNVETGVLENVGDRVRGKPDDIMGLIIQATERAAQALKLPAIPAGASRDAANAAQEKAKKVPFQNVVLYSRALEAQDKGDKAGAVQLLKQAVERFPGDEKSAELKRKLEGGL
jgi:TolB-like protein